MSDMVHHELPTPPHIRLLPDEVIERIAAGEVIERPASVVRELLDNALDSGARAIRVELRDGGLRLIRVADDGCGIRADDLPLACAPHTTSKVASLADLDTIHTLGFRGEALASIATVAELEIVSACDDSSLAASLSLHADGTQVRRAVARACGTTVTVRNLFTAVPARRALLRGPRGEAARVLAIVRAYALAYPAVSFTLSGDGHLILQTHGAGLESAVTTIYGSDAGKALLPLEFVALEQASITGAVANRAFSFPARDHVVLAVNGRPVTNRALLAAAEAGYRPLLRKGRHPLLVVNLTVPPDRVDPNIHPAKAEVLLRDEAALAAALRTAVHATLGAAPLSIGHEPPSGARFRPVQPIQLRLPSMRRRRAPRLAERAAPRYTAAPLPSPDEDAERRAGLTALGQFDDTLILARSAAGSLYLVDQHRAHERALYERLKQQVSSLSKPDTPPLDDEPPDSPRQLLMEPVLVELTPLQAARLAPRTTELTSLGLECQDFGGSVFLIRSLPDIPGAASSPAAFAAELAQAAAEDTDDWLDHVCVSLACRSAIRRGQPLSPSRQQALLDGLQSLPARAVCPHGSPLLLRLTTAYLSRTFEW